MFQQGCLTHLTGLSRPSRTVLSVWKVSKIFASGFLALRKAPAIFASRFRNARKAVKIFANGFRGPRKVLEIIAGRFRAAGTVFPSTRHLRFGLAIFLPSSDTSGMASDPDLDELARFLSKVLEIQLSDSDEQLTEETLAKMARNAGLSEEDWKRVCGRLEQHLQKGRNFLAFENYGDAIVELEQAVELAPYRSDVLCDCGEAHLRNWKDQGVKPSRDRSEELLQRSLEFDPSNVEAARLLSEHRKLESATRGRSRKAALVGAAVVATVTAWIGMANPWAEPAGERAEERTEISPPMESALPLARNWEWESGGELVLEEDGTATHTEWKREGAWSLYPDGSIFLEAPTGTFRINFQDGVGHVRHLQRGGSTTIVPKI